MQNDKAATNNYFGDDSNVQSSFLNQSQQLANQTIYRTKKPGPN